MIKKKDVWIQAWTAEQPIFKHYAQTQTLIKYRHLIGNVARQSLFYSINGLSRRFLTEEGYQAIQNDGKKLLNPKRARQTIKEIKRTITVFLRFRQKLRYLLKHKENLHGQKFVNLFRNFNNLTIKIFAYFLTTWEATSFYPEERLRNILKIYFPIDWEEKFITLVTPVEPDLLFKEKFSWLKILKKPQEQVLEQHMLKFSFLFTNIDRKEDALKIMQKRLKEDLVLVLEKEILATRERLKEIKFSQNKIFRKIKSKEIKDIASLLQQFTLSRLELKNCWAGIHFYLFGLFSRIAEETGFSTRDIMMFWSFEDVLKFLSANDQPSVRELEKRKEFYLLLLDHDKIKFYIGQKARKVKSNILDKFRPEGLSSLNGSVANKGKVSGRVRLIDFDDLRLIEKAARGIKGKFVLVTGMTNPNMVPLIKKAKAIVTDEGGITCHAAIISREFNIPCVIGTRVATRVFKNGDLVEVNANRGIVKKI